MPAVPVDEDHGVPDSTTFLCYDCEFVPAKVVKPMRIFRNCGRDANEELVRRIQTDFDQNAIKAGDDWRARSPTATGTHAI
jgi:hypothetical protein